MNEFLRRFLTPKGAAEVHLSVVAAHEWFTHGTSIDDFERIKESGLEARWPGGGVPDELREARGMTGMNIVCFAPYPVRVRLHKNGSWLFKMALHRDDLPRNLGLDFTFGGTYDKAAQLHAQDPSLSVADVYMMLLSERQVVATFDSIRPELLRVCPKTAPDAPPSQWPRLMQTARSDVELFGPPDIPGYVVI